MTHTILGIDVGATTISGGLVTDQGDVLEVIQAATHRDGPGTAVETLLEVGGVRLQVKQNARISRVRIFRMAAGAAAEPAEAAKPAKKKPARK